MNVFLAELPRWPEIVFQGAQGRAKREEGLLKAFKRHFEGLLKAFSRPLKGPFNAF